MFSHQIHVFSKQLKLSGQSPKLGSSVWLFTAAPISSKNESEKTIPGWGAYMKCFVDLHSLLTNFLRLCKTFFFLDKHDHVLISLPPSILPLSTSCLYPKMCPSFNRVLWSCLFACKSLPFAGGHMIQSRPMSQSPIGDQWHLGSFAHFLSVFAKHFCTLFKVEELSAITDIHVRHGFIRKAKHYRYMWLNVIACDCMCFACVCTCFMAVIVPLASWWSLQDFCKTFHVDVGPAGFTVPGVCDSGGTAHCHNGNCRAWHLESYPILVYCRSCYYQNPLIISHYIYNIIYIIHAMYIYMIYIIYIYTIWNISPFIDLRSNFLDCTRPMWGDLMPRAASWGRARHSRVSTKGNPPAFYDAACLKVLTW